MQAIDRHIVRHAGLAVRVRLPGRCRGDVEVRRRGVFGPVCPGVTTQGVGHGDAVGGPSRMNRGGGYVVRFLLASCRAHEAFGESHGLPPRPVQQRGLGHGCLPRFTPAEEACEKAARPCIGPFLRERTFAQLLQGAGCR